MKNELGRRFRNFRAVCLALLAAGSCCAQTDPGATSSLRLTGGTINGQSISPSNPSITVISGATLSGSFSIQINSTYGSNAVMSMGATPTWGTHSSSFIDLNHFSSPTSGLARTATVNWQAPTTAGTYYIVAAFSGEFTAAQVMSCTNWGVSSPVWNDGNDVADWSAATIETAIANGRVQVAYRFSDGMHQMFVPSTAIRVNVTAAVPPLTITSTSLAAGTVNAGYSQALTASGGTPPYNWSAAGLPSGLSLNSSSGVLSGTPSSAGTFNVNVTVADSSSPRGSATKTYALVVGAAPLPPANTAPAVTLAPSNTQITAITTQPTVALTLGSPASADLTVTLGLSFTPNASGLPSSYSNPGLRFASGGTTSTVTIPRGGTSVSLPANDAIQVGSVAGTITVRVTGMSQVVNGQTQTMTMPSPAPSTTITVARMAPTVTSARIINMSSTGFTVDIMASSTPRDLSSANITFSPAGNGQLNGSSFTISLSSQATSWFSSANGQNNGGAFNLQVPFTYSGDTSALGSVSVQLVNSAGTSSAVSGGY